MSRGDPTVASSQECTYLHHPATSNAATNAARFFGERVADLGGGYIICPAAAHRQGRTARFAVLDMMAG